MRIILSLPLFLILILSNPLQTVAVDCRCECCTSNNCNPTLVASHPLWFCSEPTSCSKSDCIAWHPGNCPPEDSIGQTRAICASNAKRLLPTLFIILGFNSIIFFLYT